MDKIWYRNPWKSEVIGGDEKNEWPRRTDKSRTLKTNNKKMNIQPYYLVYLALNSCHKYRQKASPSWTLLIVYAYLVNDLFYNFYQTFKDKQ